MERPFGMAFIAAAERDCERLYRFGGVEKHKVNRVVNVSPQFALSLPLCLEMVADRYLYGETTCPYIFLSLPVQIKRCSGDWLTDYSAAKTLLHVIPGPKGAPRAIARAGLIDGCKGTATACLTPPFPLPHRFPSLLGSAFLINPRTEQERVCGGKSVTAVI